jgi:acetyltransferase-like isoleucine patch superfamily enzyme
MPSWQQEPLSIKDVPDNAIVVGIPTKVINMIEG